MESPVAEGVGTPEDGVGAAADAPVVALDDAEAPAFPHAPDVVTLRSRGAFGGFGVPCFPPEVALAFPSLLVPACAWPCC